VCIFGGVGGGGGGGGGGGRGLLKLILCQCLVLPDSSGML
jgi:hypothetical protein